MKRILIIAILLLASCGPPQEEYEQEWYEQRISNWWDKEWTCLENPTYHNDPDYIIDMDALNEAYLEAKREIIICEDPTIEWKSSCEIAQCMRGDCDTCAVWMWRKLLDKGWPDNVNGMMIIYFYNIDSYHLLNAVKYQGDFIMVDVTQILNAWPMMLSEIKGTFYPVVWFNLFEYREF